MTDLTLSRPGSSSVAAGPGLIASAERLPGVVVAIVVGWLLIATAQITGTAALLHHDALIEHGPPLVVAVPSFLGAWLVMVVAMMIPASLPAIATSAAWGSRVSRFLAPYVLIWAGFGIAVFAGDAMLHRLVDATPWLAARPWLIDASVIGIAGAFQLTPLKLRSLDACRHPATLITANAAPGLSRLGPGFAHGVACLGASWALMLLMFAEGFSNPIPMLGLSVVMTYEATGRYGQLLRRFVGLGLVSLAVMVAATGISV
jgi:Predicted metal-binding integral membrane protein